MFNHGPLSSTVHGYQESNDCLHLVTLQDWTSGSEVKFSYGPLPNSRLLLLHGFCLPDNPFESVELWAMMEPGAPGFAEKSKVGVGAGRKNGSAIFSHFCAASPQLRARFEQVLRVSKINRSLS